MSDLSLPVWAGGHTHCIRVGLKDKDRGRGAGSHSLFRPYLAGLPQSSSSACGPSSTIPDLPQRPLPFPGLHPRLQRVFILKARGTTATPHSPPALAPRSQESGRRASLGCRIESWSCVQRGACPLNPRAQQSIPWGEWEFRHSFSPPHPAPPQEAGFLFLSAQFPFLGTR